MKSVMSIAVMLFTIMFSCNTMYAAGTAKEKYSAFMETDSNIKDADTRLNNLWDCGRKILNKSDFSKLLEEQREWLVYRDNLIRNISLSESSAKQLAECINDRVNNINYYLYACKVFDTHNEFKKIDKNITTNAAKLNIQQEEHGSSNIGYILKGNNIISKSWKGKDLSNNNGYWYVEKSNVILITEHGIYKTVFKVEGNKYICNDNQLSLNALYYNEDDKLDVGTSDLKDEEKQAHNGESAYSVHIKYKNLGNTIKSAIWCIKAAEYGYKNAYEEAAALLIAGESVPLDYKRGFAYYKKAEEIAGLSAAGKVDYAIKLKEHGYDNEGDQKILDLAKNADITDKLGKMYKNRLFIYAADIELKNSNYGNALAYWDNISNKNHNSYTNNAECNILYRLNNAISALKTEKFLKDFKEYYLPDFSQEEGYTSVWEAFSSFFSEPSWNVRHINGHNNAFAIIFKGILKHSELKKLYEFQFVLQYNNGVAEFPLGEAYGLASKVNGKALSADEYRDMLYGIMLEAKK